MKKLYGVTTAMVTPMLDNNTVDLEGVSTLTNFLVEKGVNCLYPLGTTGEMLKLTVDERKRVAETVVKTANNRVTVFIHVGSMITEETIELAKHAKEIGADGIGVVTPQFFGVNDRELENYFVEVAESVGKDFPMYLYSIPQCASNDISPNLLEKVMNRCENIIGIKYSYADFVQTQEYTFVNDSNVSVMHGCDRLFIPILAMGCDGTISGISGVYPEPFVASYKAYTEGNLKEAIRIQKIAAKFCKTLRGGSNMAYFKEALRYRGINVGTMRKPALDLTEEEKFEFKKELEVLDLLLNQVCEVAIQ